jgi:carboxypeptidase C (cathepsin A)
VYAFAMSDYLTALVKGRELPHEERTQIAQRLSEMTGLSAEYHLSHDLAISKERFREEILKDEGLIVGRYDARYTGAAARTGKPASDPSMKMSAAFEVLVKEHLTNFLGVTIAEEYRPLNREAAASWDYGGPRSPFADYDFARSLARLMKLHPNLRLMIGTGRYDTTTTTGAARYFVTRSLASRACDVAHLRRRTHVLHERVRTRTLHG